MEMNEKQRPAISVDSVVATQIWLYHYNIQGEISTTPIHYFSLPNFVNTPPELFIPFYHKEHGHSSFPD